MFLLNHSSLRINTGTEPNSTIMKMSVAYSGSQLWCTNQEKKSQDQEYLRIA